MNDCRLAMTIMKNLTGLVGAAWIRLATNKINPGYVMVYYGGK
jgi:hypothetical protein